MSNATATPAAPLGWAAANRRCLEGELHRLRLLLRRRVAWLRSQWPHDPLESYRELVVSDERADWLLEEPDRRAELAFYASDPAAAELSAALAELEAGLARLRGELAAASLPPAPDLLAGLFGLSPLERDTLLLCLAAELDPAFERLFAYVQDDVGRRYATPQLALTLLGDPHGAGLGSFRAEAPLRRFHLVMLEPGPLPATPWTARPLRLDERVAAYLCGANQLDGRVAELLRPLPALPLGAEQSALAGRLAQWLLGQGRPPILNLVGRAGAGRRALAAELCARLGLSLYELSPRRLPPPGPERQELLRLLEREAALLQLALLLEPPAAEPGEPPIDDLLAGAGLFLILASEERWGGDAATLAVEVARPAAAEQLALWRSALGGELNGLEGPLTALAQQFSLGPAAVMRATGAARGFAGLRGAGDQGLTAGDLWRACREQGARALDDLARRILPAAGWDDIVLPPDARAQLGELADQVAHRHRVYEEWGFGARLSRGRGISALFAGPSGTGKTMAAEVLAAQLELDLYRIDLAGVVSKYIGETEKNLRRVFDAAEASGAILFFDEADALFGKRSEVKDSHDRYANIEIDYLLQRMEEYRGLAILATNRKAALDRAFLRRLRFLIDFPFPDAEQRRQIWERAFPPQTPLAGVDFAALARMELAGGNIKNVALNAAFLAAAAAGPVGMEHVVQAARREYAKIEKIPSQAELGQYYILVKGA